MSLKELILKELEKVPDQYLEEILNYIRFLETKIECDSVETTLASESSLQKDWLLPEEDEAWQHL